MADPNLFAQSIAAHEDDRWQYLLKNCAHPSVFGDPEFLKVVGTLGYRHHRVAVIKNKTPIGGAIFFWKKHLGIRSAIPPYFVLQSPIYSINVDTTRVYSRQELYNSIQQTLLEWAASHYHAVEVRLFPPYTDVRPFLWAGWEVMPQYTAWVDLAQWENQLQQMDADFQRILRRAGEQELRFAPEVSIPALVALVEQSYRTSKISPPLRGERLESFIQGLLGSGLARTFGVYHEDRLLGATLVLEDPPYAWGLFLGRDVSVQPNHGTIFLLWKVSEYYQLKKYQKYDLGGAMIPEIATFKLKFGAVLQPIFFARYYRNALYRALFKLNEMRHRRSRQLPE